MGILRADRITGLGGANAITGSVFFPHDGDTGAGESGALQVQNANDALTFGTGDWTVEFWFYANRVGVVQTLFDNRGTGAGTNTAVLIRISDSNNIQFFTTNAFRITGSTTIIKNAWHHVALTRTGSTHTLYVNGSSDGTYSNSGMDYIGPVNNFAIIGSDDNRDGRYGLNGYISNLRVAKELIYSAAFSVPTTALVPTPNTTLLCCQSPGNAQASFGGLILTSFASNTNSKGPEASRFTPNSPVGFSTTTDVGSQYGSTFDGFGSFATSTYMVPPGGNTRERNRGRGIFMGGYVPGNYTQSIDSIEIQSLGNAIDFGDTSGTSVGEGSACSSSTRAIQGGGSLVNTMEFVTIANSSNTTDFGDLTVARRSLNSLSSETRGIWAGGTTNPAMSDVIDFATIATAVNATDFGNLTVGRRNIAPMTSPTRGVFAGGNPGSSPLLDDTIDYITIASTGNATDFGNLITAMREQGGSSSATRGLIAGGYTSPANLNTIEFITIATTGNASDFGDLYEARSLIGGTSNATRGIFAGGSYTNTIQYVTIATTGNAADFGDLTIAKALYGATSDSHGGLS